MIANFLQVLTFAAALGAGLNAGLFFIFSVCIMSALALLPPEQGIAAMRAINIVIINPWFLVVFFGTALLSFALVLAGRSAGSPAGIYLIAGGLLYLAGTILVTVVFNVPMNNALEAVEPASEAASRLWADYLVTWVNWNHVRTLSSLGALGLFVLASKAA